MVRSVDKIGMDNNIESALRDLAHQVAATNERLDKLIVKLEESRNPDRTDCYVFWGFLASLVFVLTFACLPIFAGWFSPPKTNTDPTEQTSAQVQVME